METEERHFQVGQAHAKAGRWREASLHFGSALDVDPHSVPARLGRALVRQRLNHHREALEDFARLLEQKPGFAQARYGEAWSWRALGDASSAMDAVNEALSSSPDFVDALYLRGILRRAADHPDARADFDRVLQLDPSYREAALARGKLNVFEGLWVQAESDFSQAISHCDLSWSNHRAEAYHWRGVSRTEQGRHEEAIADLCRATELEPRNAATLTHRALAYQAAGETSQAFRDFEQVKELLNGRRKPAENEA